MRSNAKNKLPPTIELAWGLRERSGKGPKPGLSLERIVETGMRVAAREGLDAVSMNRIAAELDASTMSLYRYVRAKEELLALMVDAAFATPPAPPAAGEGWRPALSRWVRDHLAVLRRHPWVVRIPLGGPPIMPHQVVWFERALSCLKETGLTGAEKLSVLLLVNGFVRNEALLSADLHGAARASGTTLERATAAYGRLLSGLIDPQRFPELSAIVAAGLFDGTGDTDDDFDFGLERILDGIAARIRRPAPRRRRRVTSGR
jgi:AcrR family transcriptional regulator